MTADGRDARQDAVRRPAAPDRVPRQMARGVTRHAAAADVTEYMEKLSHELRTALTSITSFAGLLHDCEPPLSGEAVDFVGIIEDSAAAMLRLIADLLLVTRAESGALPLNLAPVSVPELIAEAVRAWSPAAARRGVTLGGPDGDPRGPQVPADRQLLGQLLDHLLSNAVKFTEPPGRVTITASFDGIAWRVDVTDSGIGIPAAERERVFDHFFRASNARLVQVPGSGLGLTVVRAVTALHQGRVEVQGAPGGGTTISVWLLARP